MVKKLLHHHAIGFAVLKTASKNFLKRAKLKPATVMTNKNITFIAIINKVLVVTKKTVTRLSKHCEQFAFEPCGKKRPLVTSTR